MPAGNVLDDQAQKKIHRCVQQPEKDQTGINGRLRHIKRCEKGRMRNAKGQDKEHDTGLGDRCDQAGMDVVLFIVPHFMR